VIAFESMTMHMGERHGEGKESERREHASAPESSEAPCRSQRGHSRQRVGKPRVGRRVTPREAGAVIPLRAPRKALGLGHPCRNQRNTQAVSPLMGSPCAVKAARTVATGGMEKRVVMSCPRKDDQIPRSIPTH
jgi:hypothetical protein